MSRRKRILSLVARVNSARAAIVARHKDARESIAAEPLIIRDLILIGRRARLLRAYLDDTRRPR
jgi:hypothetical protein